ncbi:MAG: hypothetical protein F4Z95_07155 [Gammaproteobacteria bacterium]|nr:hypothetical protein [Gammaproteobacteria bacterium]
MTQSSLETEINDYLTGFLLRYFRNAVKVGIMHPTLDPKRDVDLLRLHWAISQSVRDLVNHLSQNRHDIQAVLETRRYEDDGRVRGRFDARATLIRRLVTGQPTLTVSHEPARTFESGPNRVLIWVVESAWRLALHFDDLLPEGASYKAIIEKHLPGLKEIRRFDAILQATKRIDLTRRPGPQAVKEASRSRQKLYLLACKAYRELQLIEAGNSDSITRLLNDTLLGPLHFWQRYELVVALAVTKALSVALQQRFDLSFLGGGSEPVSRVGGYEVYWQVRTKAYKKPAPEPSEAMAEKLLKLYDLSSGADRPDVVVLDSKGKVVSVVEVKYSSNRESDGADSLRSAVSQLVRYSRGYRPMAQIEKLLDHSIVAVSGHETGRMPVPKPFGLPLIVDFEDILQHHLRYWADCLVEMNASGDSQRVQAAQIGLFAARI